MYIYIKVQFYLMKLTLQSTDGKFIGTTDYFVSCLQDISKMGYNIVALFLCAAYPVARRVRASCCFRQTWIPVPPRARTGCENYPRPAAHYTATTRAPGKSADHKPTNQNVYMYHILFYCFLNAGIIVCVLYCIILNTQPFKIRVHCVKVRISPFDFWSKTL